MKKAVIALALPLLHLTPTAAQVMEKADVTIPFDLSATGHRFAPTWGLDQAWISEQNLKKGINHIGKENIGIGRSCFRFTKALTNDSVISSDDISYLRQRANFFNQVSTTLPIVLTADQEAGADEYFVKNKSCNVDHWAANINSHVHWMQKNTKHPIIGVSPFNEPDYWTEEEGATVAKQWQVAKLLKEKYPRMADVNIVGGNTLNDDKALTWYTSGKQYYDWGNTHQLAGSFDNFVKFFEQLVKDGKVGYADEMHNVGEAMIGLEYGMTVGIWWGFDSRARGEFCDISRNGERLAYGEHRDNWTAASVYRHDDGRVKAFIGSSERQASTTSYQFVSLDRDVYFDGHGPLRQYRMEIPGGTGYQKGQTNAERVIDITWGADVAPTVIEKGTYKLVNKATGNVAAVSGDNIVMMKYTGAAAQQWNVNLVDPRIGGDYSFYEFSSVTNAMTRPNILNFSTNDGANVMAYSKNESPSSNEQWYLEYAGNGYYYIRSRETALYMASASNSSNNGINILMRKMQTTESARERLLWRLLPLEVEYETEAPAKPDGLLAEAMPTAARLTWHQGAEEDLDGYMVLRAEQGSSDWNTIARHVIPPFTDNSCEEGHTYIYKVKAIDRAQNMSEPSDEQAASISGGKSALAVLAMEGTLDDITNNSRNASAAVEPTFSDDAKEGAQSLSFASNQHLQLPPMPAIGDAITVAMWVKANSARNWQRLFDFGYDTEHYLFLTSRNSYTSKMRLAIKASGDEQSLDCPTYLPLNQWKHVAVTMAPGSTIIYIDGQQVAQTNNITISPRDVRPIVNYLGRSLFNSDPYYTGLMDDVQIYNYALNADEIAQLFAGTTAIGTPAYNAADDALPVYSIDGKRLEQPRRGLNIIGGKVIQK